MVAVQNAAIPPTLYAAAPAGMFSSVAFSGFSVLCLNLQRYTKEGVFGIDSIIIDL